MVYKKEQAKFYKKVGRREGKLDHFYDGRSLTMPERAKEACYAMGIYHYVRYFIEGYIETATQRGATE